MTALREAEVDYVIIGTGAGGATAARVLAEAGRSLLMLEEGPDLRAVERPRAVREAMRQSFRDGGAQTTHDRHPLPVLQGRLVGGSTAINSGIVWRLPPTVQRQWAREHGLEELVDPRVLDPIFARLEAELGVGETPEAERGSNAALLAEGAAALGLVGKPITRNVRDCAGSARCLPGCPRGARPSMDVSYVPFALARGASLWALARAEHITVRGRRATAVTGSLLHPERRTPIGSFHVRARRGVIVAAGAVHTPLLLRAAGLRGLVGQRFQAHPGAAVLGRFDRKVTQGVGATQAYEVPLPERGMKLESLSLPPELLAARMPGVGPDWQGRLAALGQYAHWVAMVRMNAQGRVRPGLLGRARIEYAPTREDLARVRDGIALLCRLLFAAGAREVSHGIFGLPPLLTHPDQVARIDDLTLTTDRIHLLASHLFGTACAGADPRTSVVGPRLESHEIAGLYVMDASVFPTNLGVNPQHSIMALAFRAAEQLS
ncbi:MAG: GMC family oxidoreductase [Polyangiales bacterium]